MPPKFSALGLGHLSKPEREEFVQQLTADIDSTEPPVVSEWMKEYVRQLQEEARANPDDWIDGDELEAKLEAEFPE